MISADGVAFLDANRSAWSIVVAGRARTEHNPWFHIDYDALQIVLNPELDYDVSARSQIILEALAYVYGWSLGRCPEADIGLAAVGPVLLMRANPELRELVHEGFLFGCV